MSRARADLPYTYTDVDGDRLAVFGADIPGKGKGVNLRTDPSGCSVPAEDAPALARAILAAAGDTGHEVVSEHQIQFRISMAMANAASGAARSMRERAAACAEDDPTADYDIKRQILALPLLPDDGDETPPVEDFDAGWSAGHTHARADEARISELEKQVADLAALVHGHGEDIGQAQAAIRGLGKQRTARPYNAWTDG